MIKATDINFVKSVKRDNGTAWAFYDEGFENTFPLTFSKTQVKGARELQPGDIILLFQRVDNHPDKSIKAHTYLTHLVTPIDTILFENNASTHRFKWERKVAVIARADLNKPIHSSPDKLNFYKPQWGKICDIQLLSDSWVREQIQEEVWNHFDGLPKQDVSKYFEVVEPPIDDFGVLEGAERSRIIVHVVRERNRFIVGVAKSRALKEGNGRIRCACCEFDFIDRYGEHGIGFIECHHIIPIAEGGERETKPEDLAMVCANCHRMLHRKNKKTDKCYTVEQLRKLILSTSLNTNN